MSAATSAQATYDLLCSDARCTALLSSIQGLLEWDERTQLPPSAGEYRADQVAWMAGEIHRRQTQPQIGEWLAELSASHLGTDPESPTGSTIARLNHEYQRKTLLPQTLVEALARLSVRGQQIWAAARKGDDFAMFLPALTETVSLKREQAAALGYESTPYDALLDEYEPGATAAAIAEIFTPLEAALRQLVQEISECGRQLDASLLGRRYPRAAQQELGKEAAAAIGFDFQAGRLDVTDHPFCCGVGPRDIRITTRYNEDDFGDAFFSILHEAGHGMYEQGLPAEHYGLPLGTATSLGIHESQSRLWENCVGRSRGFWDYFFPRAQRIFPDALGDATAEAMYRAVNRVEPSLIRVDADEVTYNLHIFIRFALERALIEGRMQPADLPVAWREQYQQNLGVCSATDANGVLQDVHWGAGLFGYFPTYALGNLYAAEFLDAAEKDLGPLQEAFREGNFSTLRTWLRNHLHCQGARYRAPRLAEQVTGHPLSERPWIRQMRAKYGELYRL